MFSVFLSIFYLNAFRVSEGNVYDFSSSLVLSGWYLRWWWEKSRKIKQWIFIPLLFKDKETDEFSWHIKQVIKSHLKQQHNQFTPFYRIVVKQYFILSQTLWNNHYVIIERINWWSLKFSLPFATTIRVVKNGTTK